MIAEDFGPVRTTLASRSPTESTAGTTGIAVYSVCHADAIATPKGQREVNRLQELGFGLVTVDPSGKPTVLFAGVPLVQVIPEDEFKRQILWLAT